MYIRKLLNRLFTHINTGERVVLESIDYPMAHYHRISKTAGGDEQKGSCPIDTFERFYTLVGEPGGLLVVLTSPHLPKSLAPSFTAIYSQANRRPVLSYGELQDTRRRLVKKLPKNLQNRAVFNAIDNALATMLGYDRHYDIKHYAQHQLLPFRKYLTPAEKKHYMRSIEIPNLRYTRPFNLMS